MTAPYRLSIIDLMIVVPFAAGLAICIALIFPVLWTAIAESTLQPASTYQHCAALKEDAVRLGCYDHVRHEHLPKSAKE